MAARDRYTLFDLQQQQERSRSQQERQQQQQERQQQLALPKFVTVLILRDAATNGKLCSITMDPIEIDTDTFTVTPCYHAFNKEALQRWTRDHATCPECNQRL